MSITRKEYINTLIEYSLFIIFIYFINPMLSTILEVAEYNNTEGELVHYLKIDSAGVLFLTIIAIILEVISFYFIKYQKKISRGICSMIIVIPRIILYMEIIRILAINYYGVEILENSAVALFFISLLIVIVKEVIVLIFMNLSHYEGTKYNEQQQYYIAKLLYLPLFFIWLAFFQETDLRALLLEYQDDKFTLFFVFIGLYSIFIYLPLHIPWIVLSLEKKKMVYFQIAEVIIQPIIVYSAI